MEREYVVVRSKQPVRRGTTRGGPVLASPVEEEAGLEGVEIEAPSLSEAERLDVVRDPQVRALAAVMPMRLIEPVESTDVQPQAGSTWGVDAVKASQSPFDGSGVTVAVLDTGIDTTHPAFAGVNLVQGNFTTGGADDTHGHGTHCAGTIFGQDVGGQRIGIARNIDKALIGKVLGPGGGSSATITRAIRWAVDEGATVISMSLGIDFPGFVDDLVNLEDLNIQAATSLALAEYRHNINLFNALADLVRAQASFAQGTIIVAASGNESNRPQYSIAVAPPAAGTGIAAVGALGQSGAGLTVASFSNSEVDFCAPGVGVVSAALGGGLTSKSGTSMATPHVAGVAALWGQKMLQATGFVNPVGLMAQLTARADTTVLAPGFVVDDVGAGIVQSPLA